MDADEGWRNDRKIPEPFGSSWCLADVEIAFHVGKGAGHGFGGPEINEMVRQFLAKHLKK